MKKLLIVLFMYIPIGLSAQDYDPIMTKEQNADWVKKLAKQDLTDQLEMLKTRWQEDAEYHFQVSASPHRIISEDKVSPKCRPLYLINRIGEGQIIFPANPSSQVIAEVSKMIIPENISEVKVETENTQLLYGLRGSCGVIVITVSENVIFDRIASEVNQ